jgi:hypothetical protein
MTSLSESSKNSLELASAGDEWWVDFIPEQESKTLKSSCAILGIIGDDFDDVYITAALLRSFEKHDKPKIPTIKQRINAIKKAVDISNKLLLALDAIDVVDASGTLFKARIRFDVELERMQNGLHKVLGSLEVESKSGRRPLLDEYSMFIGFLWDDVKARDFSPGRNNNFHKLCDAVFLAAGVPAKAEGALRRYLSKGESLA